MKENFMYNSYSYINEEWEEYLKKCEDKISKINKNCSSGFDEIDKVIDGGFKRGCVYFVISNQNKNNNLFIKNIIKNFKEKNIKNNLINIEENSQYEEVYDIGKQNDYKVIFVKTPKKYEEIQEKDFFFLSRIATKNDMAIIVIAKCKNDLFVSTSFCLHASFVLNNIDDKTFLKLYNHKNQRTYKFFVDTSSKNISISKNSEVEFKELLKESRSDPLYQKALKLVVQNNTASISFLQRKLLIGYPRAAFLIDKMEDDGYISCPDQIGKRQVLIDVNEYVEKFGNIDD